MESLLFGCDIALMVCLGYWAFKAARTQADAITGLFRWRQMAAMVPARPVEPARKL